MDIPALWLRGLVIGFSIAAPVGPIGVLCIRRTLQGGRRLGLVSGLGAATADAVYGSLAAFGVSLVVSLLTQQQFLLRVVGGIFLCYLGIRAFFFSRPTDPTTQTPSTASLMQGYVSTFLLTLTNPMTILSFAAVFSGLGLATQGGDPQSAMAVVAGVFCGSALWWFTLSLIVSPLRGPLTTRGMVWINRVSGVVLLAFGVLALFHS
ncbi:MAG: LysE family translocator [Anaerolineaceae bacterium]